jgi:uncharacterized membrane protein
MRVYVFLITSIILVILDSIYLNVAKNYFNKQINLVQGSNIDLNLTATILCYIFIIIGFNYFVIYKKLSSAEAGLLGLIIYGIYELTNMALFKKWKWTSVVMDTVWGGILFFLTSVIVRMFFKI